MRAATALGRLLFSGYFIYNGVNHVRNREMMTQYAASKGVINPEAAVLGSGALLLLGGTSVLSGYKPRAGLALIALFLGSVTPVMHRFWDAEDAPTQMNEQINFLKNVALFGAALMLLGRPAGRHDGGSAVGHRPPLYDSGLPTD